MHLFGLLRSLCATKPFGGDGILIQDQKADAIDPSGY